MYYKRKAAARKIARKPYRKRMAMKSAISRITTRGTMVYKGNCGIADRAVLKMKYVDNYVLTSPTFPNAQYAWRLNSLYDPDNTGGGHQPLSYDEWSIFYKAYRVYKTDVILHLANQENEAVQVAWIVQPDSNTITSTDAAFEQPHTFSKILGGTQGQNRAVIKRSIYHPRLLGQQSKQYRANENTYALFGSNPNTSIYGILFANSIDNSTLPNISVNVTLVFHCELFDRKQLQLSGSVNPPPAPSQ